jgi:hypothetical protein
VSHTKLIEQLEKLGFNAIYNPRGQYIITSLKTSNHYYSYTCNIPSSIPDDFIFHIISQFIITIKES